MSSFKRKAPSRQAVLPPGTRACPISISTVLTSSGIPSLDDILGGGVPLSCLLAILAPDTQSAYGELVQKYFIAQGIASGHKTCVVHENALSFTKECMWVPASSSDDSVPVLDEDDVAQGDEKIKIAWRYERMKKIETTVTSLQPGHFCGVFDLTCRIPMSVIDTAQDEKRLIPLNLATNDDFASMDGLLVLMKHILATSASTDVVRFCIVALGSPEWGEYDPEVRKIASSSECGILQDILHFLYVLRRLLRQHPHACACVTLAPHLCTDLWRGSGWIQKVGWVTDAAITMSGFGANPALTTLFPSHHGLVEIHKLPTPHSILPTSDKHSTLRGLSLSAGASIGTGENNIAFKCMRKRFIFETMHLDLDGGVAERRTTPSSMAIGLDVGDPPTHIAEGGALARVGVELEEGVKAEGQVSLQSADSANAQGTKRTKKKVTFHSDKADLYDF